MPVGVAVPTVVPPLVHVVGALACGPKTVKVMVLVSFAGLAPRVAVMLAAEMAVPAVLDAGAATVSVGDAWFTVALAVLVAVETKLVSAPVLLNVAVTV